MYDRMKYISCCKEEHSSLLAEAGFEFIVLKLILAPISVCRKQKSN